MDAGSDPSVWVGVSLLFAPMALFLTPGTSKHLAKLYYAQDDLELTRYRRRWMPPLLSILIAVPDILLLRSRNEVGSHVV